jgi:hypothetical protein
LQIGGEIFIKKKIFAVCIVFVLAVMAAFIFGYCVKNVNDEPDVIYKVRDDVKYYEEDYTVKYSDVLDKMFSTGWSVTDKAEKRESVDGCEHTDTRDIDYFVWSIEYTDINGTKNEFKLDNHTTLAYQVDNYLTKSIKEYYETEYFDKYYGDISVANRGVCVTFPNPPLSTDDDITYDEWDAILDSVDSYEKSLAEVENAVDFSTLNPQKVFEAYPLNVYLYITLDDVSGDKLAGNKFVDNEFVKKRTEQMLEEISQNTNGCFNVEVSITGEQYDDKSDDGEIDWLWYYIKGKEINTYDEWSFYNAYREQCFEQYLQ